MDYNFSLLELIEQIRRSVLGMRRSGVDSFSCSERTLDLLDSWNSGNGMKKEVTLASINEGVKNCELCELYKQRTNVVFGEGNNKARLVFIGEAPGIEEDKSGKPFVGKAGQLLSRILSAMGFDRSDVYISNVVKCRPPRNRNPYGDEIEKCLPFLRQQISVIRPEIICLLGAVASKSFLGVETPISRLRGNFISLSEMDYAKIMPTYHPAYLLRNPNKKKEVWADMQKIIKVM